MQDNCYFSTASMDTGSKSISRYLNAQIAGAHPKESVIINPSDQLTEDDAATTVTADDGSIVLTTDHDHRLGAAGQLTPPTLLGPPPQDITAITLNPPLSLAAGGTTTKLTADNGSVILTSDQAPIGTPTVVVAPPTWGKQAAAAAWKKQA